MGDFWKLVLGGVITLVGSALLHQLQLGTRTRRCRRDIREQLELLQLLGEDYREGEDRIRRRIAARLEVYEPSEEVVRRRRDRWVSGLAFASSLVFWVGGSIASGMAEPDFAETLILALIIVGTALALEELVSRVLQGRAEAQAIMTFDGVLRPKVTRHERRPDSAPQQAPSVSANE